MSIVIIAVGLIIFSAHLFTSVFERTRIPDVLLLMILGILIGPILGLVRPEDFGKFGSVATTIALIVILFEGGIHLNISEIKDSIDETLVVTLVTFVVTCGLVALPMWLLFGVPKIVALLTGVILGGTSSAVVIPIINKLQVGKLTYMVLFLESALTDVICIVTTMSLLEAYRSGSIGTGQILGKILASLILAAVIGSIGGFLWAFLLKRLKQLPNTAITTLAYIFVLYGFSEFLGYSGAIASLSFGITMANLKLVSVERIRQFTRFGVGPQDEISSYERTFFQEIVFLLKIFFFIYLGLSIKFTNWKIIAGGFAITVLIFLGRLVSLRFTMSKAIKREDAFTMAALVPKGLAAAVLASIPLQYGVANADIVQDIANIVVFFSILIAAGLVSALTLKAPYLSPVYNFVLQPFPETLPEITGDQQKKIEEPQSSEINHD